MIVKPKENSRSAEGWLLKGQPVTVLSINFALSVGAEFTIKSNIQNIVALFPSSEFEIIDPKLPSNWVAMLNMIGNLELLPQQWAEDPNFWDKYNDGDSDATRLFEIVYKEMTEL